MCGIAAIVADSSVTGGESAATADPDGALDRVVAMLERLRHRGPDGQDTHIIDRPEANGSLAVLGHTRLAIIDPAGGRQPLLHPGPPKAQAPALIANGMIYNYRELRQQLDETAFATGSDSETILHLWEQIGVTDTAMALDGMFAFVIAHGDRVVAARDPIGIKPLYLGRSDDGRLCFASEIKALAAVAERIEPFPAGHAFDSRDGGAAPRPYYTVPAPDLAPIRDAEEAARRVRRTLETAVVKRLRSDVPLGCFLSGGLDSSVIAALAARHVPRLKTFSVGLAGSRDLEAAERVAAHLGTDHHAFEITPESVQADLSDILYHLESFDRDLVRSAVPTWFVARMAAEQVKVVLTGEGADELFAGYSYHKAYAGDLGALQQELRRSITAMHDINLQRVDRMTMAHGLEARVPFLDKAMIALAARIDPSLKLARIDGHLVEKWVLRRAVEDLLPTDIVWRGKEQFDQGSGLADLMAAEAADPAPVMTDFAALGRNAEERWYADVMASRFDRADRVMPLVSHWVSPERIAA